MESTLAPRTGKLDLGLSGAGTRDAGRFFGYLDVEGRLTEALSLYGRGEAGVQWAPEEHDLFWSVLGGIRYRW